MAAVLKSHPDLPPKMTVFIKYKHHENDVWTRWDLLVKSYRKNCLCFDCELLNMEERKKNCPIANQVFDLCVKEHLVLPVWECPKFKEKV